MDLNFPKPTVHKTNFSCCLFKKIDFYEFNKDIASAFSSVERQDLDSFLQFFNTTLIFILDVV